MSGWLADFIRFWWALFYWNSRKGWFRLRGAHRDDCPCQNASDSGLARDTRCDAITHWHRPERFQRVCPLLMATPDGLRCGVEAERVRPFWGRALVFGAGLLVGLYLVVTATIFATLRWSHYELSYLAIAWPARWDEIHLAREKFYANQARSALEAGRFAEAISALETVCRINPQNYAAGLTLARLTQLTDQPAVSEHVYERLMADIPEHRVQTARLWFRALLARESYEKLIPLSAGMLGEDPEQRADWLQALLFSARQTRSADALISVLQENPHFPDWCTEILNLEIALLQDRLAVALPKLSQPRRQLKSDFFARYQIETLLQHAKTTEASELLDAYQGQLTRSDFALLRLRYEHAIKRASGIEQQQANALATPMTATLAAKISAHLITQPSADLTRQQVAKLTREGPSLSTETLPIYNATYLASVVAGDQLSADQLRAQLQRFTASDGRALESLAQLLGNGGGSGASEKLRRLLPLVPLPTEVTYVILARQSESSR